MTTFDFENDKQREAARIILKRCGGDIPPNKIQLSKLVIEKSSYQTQDSAISFVKEFVGDSSTPLKTRGDDVIRTDIKKGVVV